MKFRNLNRYWRRAKNRLLRKPRSEFSYKINGKTEFFQIQIFNQSEIHFNFEKPGVKAIYLRDKHKAALLKAFPGQVAKASNATSALQRLNGLSLIRADLRRAKKYLSEANSKRLNSRTEGLIIAAIIMYMKAFTSTNGRIQINQNIIPESLIDSHDQIKDLRNKYLSHSDLTADYELTTTFIIFDEGHFLVQEPLLQNIRIFEALTLLPPLLEFLDTHIGDLIYKSQLEAEQIMNSMLKKHP